MNNVSDFKNLIPNPFNPAKNILYIDRSFFYHTMDRFHSSGKTIADIIAVTGDGNYSNIHLTSGETLLYSYTTKRIGEHFPELVRIKKGTLINVAYVKSYQLSTNKNVPGYVVMKNGLQLEVSRRLKVQIRQLLGKAKGKT